ncbi:uncharacterized protein [Montipora capricornis]|uniref:uncharacterized protein n=1 Tax=Montipora capricornis TaxID=246305 RepID=UPI0035F1C3D9
MASCYRIIKATCIVINLIMHTLLLVMNYAANNRSGILFGNNSIGNMARKYSIEFTPAPLAFEIWELINAWTSVWIIYSLTHIFRTSVPDVLPPMFFVCFSLATVSNIAWTQLMSWEIIQPTTGFVFALMAFLYVTLLCSYAGLYKQRDHIGRLDFWIVQLLVNNGIAVYATWVTVAALRSLSLNMTYFHGIKQELSASIVLGILALLTLIWFILENTLLKKHLLYTLTIYPVSIWVLAACVIFNFDRVAPVNRAIIQALLAMSCTFYMEKICRLIWCAVQMRRDTQAVDGLEMSPASYHQNTEQKYTHRVEDHNQGCHDTRS